MSRTVRTRTVVLAGLVASLLIAGVVSFYASSHPDGLEYVAEQTGFLDTAEDSATAEGPFADYSARGVDDERLSGGLAGVLGALATLLIAGGIAWAVRRRGSPADAGPDAEADAPVDDGVAPSGQRR
jgi:hypothetical protein